MATKKCSKCLQVLPLDCFYQRGKSGYCKVCSRKYSADKRKANPTYAQDWYKDNADRLARKHTRRTSRIAEWLAGHGCEITGETNPKKLCLHHLNPKKKRFAVQNGGDLKTRRWSSIVAEIKKCVIVTKQYHAVLHCVLRGEKIKDKFNTKQFRKFMKRYYPEAEIK
jgi:hypothetical protein